MQRRLSAIFAADLVGYSRLIEIAGANTLSRLKSLRRGVLDPCIASHNGRVVKLMGDGMLVEFASVVDAFGCFALADSRWQTPSRHRAVGPRVGEV